MATKSGTFWVTWANQHAVNSNSVEDLADPFKGNVKAFIKALQEAGAQVNIRETKRSEKRAYLYHWSWKIGLGKAQASHAGTLSAVDIQWDHGSEAASKAGAMEMVNGFGLAVPPASQHPPALTSRHIVGRAIDMIIHWTGTVIVKKNDGTTASVRFTENIDDNAALHSVGASYGVKKLIGDKPHWSDDGH